MGSHQNIPSSKYIVQLRHLRSGPCLLRLLLFSLFTCGTQVSQVYMWLFFLTVSQRVLNGPSRHKNPPTRVRLGLYTILAMR